MSEWTIESLKEHIDQRFDDTDKALSVAKDSMEKRLDGMNEFREQLNRQQGTFITKAEHQLVLDSVLSLDRRMTSIEGRDKGIGQSWGIFVALVTMALGILYIIFTVKK